MIYTDLNTEIDVGSSGHLIEFGPFRALVDCGLHPKYMGLSALPNLSKVPPETLDFIAVTHTHLDHCGSLPVVARHQSSAHILVADESYELLFRMLRNSRTVMAKQREEFNIKEYPLFDYSAIDELRSRVAPFAHTRRYEIDGNLADITFYPAGHIPGAASVMFEYKKQKILFSGDISFHSTGILKGAVPPQGKVDTLVVFEARRHDIRQRSRAVCSLGLPRTKRRRKRACARICARQNAGDSLYNLQGEKERADSV